jgi:hypothetical protein
MDNVWIFLAFYHYGTVTSSTLVLYWFFGWSMYDRTVEYGTIDYYLNTTWGYFLCILLWPVMWLIRRVVGRIRIIH